MILLCAGFVALSGHAAEWHVASGGDDRNEGSPAAPFRTIQRAADAAWPGDTVTVHEGVYRERVNPPRGGESETRRIVYRAAPGEQAVVTGSEPVGGWARVTNDTWKASVSNRLFGAFNPFSDTIRGDWFNAKGRPHHTGAVYLNGEWLDEAAKLEDVLKPAGDAPLWFSQVDSWQTTIWAQFKGVNPNGQLVEVNARSTVFYPDKPGRGFITVRGFKLRQAATPWAPPTAEQPGLIGSNWSRGWIIESNVVSHSKCVGISLGKHGDAFDNTSADSAEGYVKTIERAYAHAIPWTRENIGHHVVRGNVISHCEQAGVVGSLGGAFSLITGNVIHDIHVRRLFTGAEMAGIKLHAAIDCEISGNRIFRTCRALWMDWMAQGTRISRNLCYDNASEDLFMEVDHGPYLVDNNIFLSAVNLLDMSEGGAFAHNLWAGKIISAEEPGRETPFHPAHATPLAGLRSIKGGDNRFYNNLFVGAGAQPPAKALAKEDRRRRMAGYGTWVYDAREQPCFAGGNVYLNGARPYAQEDGPAVEEGTNPGVRLVEDGAQVYLEFAAAPGPKPAAAALVTTKRLGQALVSQAAYENADGSPLAVDADYFGARRDGAQTAPGPFAATGAGRVRIRVW